jgi:hypothetical protein
MRKILIALAMLASGCHGGPGEYVVTGSAYVESERPDGKAVAKVEVQYRPPAEKRELTATPTSAGATLGTPVSVER